MIVQIKADIDTIFSLQAHCKETYKSNGLEIKDFIYICQDSLYLVIKIL